MSTFKRSRIRWLLKWTAAAVAVFGLAASYIGTYWTAGVEAPVVCVWVVGNETVIFVYNGYPYDPKTMKAQKVAFWCEDRAVEPQIRRIPHGNREIRAIGRPRKFKLAVPSPLMVVLGLIVFGWITWRDRQRILPGLCQKCGYDLTGNVSGICPECGVAISKDAEVE